MGQQQSTQKQFLYSSPIGEKVAGCSQIRRNPQTIEKELTDRISDSIVTYQDLWQNSVANHPFNIAFGQRSKHKDRAYYTRTYSEVDRICQEIGSGVQNLKLAETLKEYKDYSLQMVGIYAKNREEWLMIDIACGIMQGMTIIPLYDTLGPENLEYCINHSGVSVMFACTASIDNLLKQSNLGKLKHLVALDDIKEDQIEKAQKKGLDIMSLEQIREAGRKQIRPFMKVTPETIFTFSYTSGTTGTPKAAMLSHKNMVSMAGAIQQNKDINLRSDDIHLSYLPLPHVMDRCVCCGVLSVGGAIYFYNGDILQIKQDIADVRPTIFTSVPRLFNKFYDAILKGINNGTKLKKFLGNKAIESKLANLKSNNQITHPLWDKLVFSKIKDGVFGGRVRIFLTGSAPISKEVIDFFQIASSTPMIEGYGQTESCAASFITFGEDNEIGHVGGPQTNIEFKVEDVPEMNYLSTDIDANGNSLPRGEICFRGPGVFAGYYKDEEKTNETIDQDGWLHSGDVGCINQNGSLKIIDRKKNIFKLSQGEYVAPEKIEAVYSKCQSVAEVFVHGDSLQSYLVGVIVPDKMYIQNLGKELGVDSTFEELCKNIEIRKNVLRNMNQQGKRDGLFGFEQVKNIYLEPVSMQIHGCVTNTMKMQRYNAKQVFLDRTTDLYSEGMII